MLIKEGWEELRRVRVSAEIVNVSCARFSERVSISCWRPRVIWAGRATWVQYCIRCLATVPFWAAWKSAERPWLVMIIFALLNPHRQCQLHHHQQHRRRHCRRPSFVDLAILLVATSMFLWSWEVWRVSKVLSSLRCQEFVIAIQPFSVRWVLSKRFIFCTLTRNDNNGCFRRAHRS